MQLFYFMSCRHKESPLHQETVHDARESWHIILRQCWRQQPRKSQIGNGALFNSKKTGSPISATKNCTSTQQQIQQHQRIQNQAEEEKNKNNVHSISIGRTGKGVWKGTISRLFSTQISFICNPNLRSLIFIWQCHLLLLRCVCTWRIGVKTLPEWVKSSGMVSEPPGEMEKTWTS